MGRWDAQRVASLAPDPSALAAARKLARPGPWSETGCSDVLVWGSCQGSGSTPYRTSVDLTGPAFRCSCPSRKFPCKHALALLMLWSDGTVGEGGMDPAAEEWARTRAQRVERTAPASAAPDRDAQAKRLAERLALMDGGAEDAARWLGDLLRSGVAEARGRAPEYWDTAARRLVDAQLPGVAARVRRLPAAFRRPDWTTAVLDELGLLWALLQAWQRRDGLDAETAADVRAAVGWALPGAEVRDRDTTTGDWAVLGIRTSEEGRVTEQRTWLRSAADGEDLVVLDFAAGGSPLPVARLVGRRLTATVSRYPGSTVRRAILHDGAADGGPSTGLGDVVPLSGAFDAAAAHLTANPWAVRTPVAVAARLDLVGRRIVDAEHRAAPLTADADPWLLAALTGGAPTAMFGELEDGAFRPLSAVVDGAVVGL